MPYATIAYSPTNNRPLYTSPPHHTHIPTQNHPPVPAPQGHSHSGESCRKDSNKLDGGSFYYLPFYLYKSYFIAIFEIFDFRFSKVLIFDYRNFYLADSQSLDAQAQDSPLSGR